MTRAGRSWSRPRELADRGEEFALATIVWRQAPSSGQTGARALITADGQVHGFIGGACAEPVVIREAQRVIQSPRGPAPVPGHDRPDDPAWPAVPDGMIYVPMSCQSEGALQVFVEPVVPVLDLLVVGRSPMVHLLAELANDLGWSARVADLPELSADDIHERSLVVVATQGHGDEEALELVRPAAAGVPRPGRLPQARACRCWSTSPSAASRRTSSTACTRRSGSTSATPRTARSRWPSSPSWCSAGPRVSSQPPGRGRRRRRSRRPPEAIDPVCGMTVTVDASRLVATCEHAGTTYHFCCVGCRDRVRGRPGALPHAIRRPEAMLVSNEFEVSQPVDKVWEFFEDVPQVAACLPGAELTDDLGDDEYAGTVEPADGAGQARSSPARPRRSSGTTTPSGWSSTRPAPTRRAAASVEHEGDRAAQRGLGSAAPRSRSTRTCRSPGRPRSTAAA